jgi:hypothetical protein
MATQIPFNADGLQTATSIVGNTFNFTDGEEVSLRPQLRKVDGNLVATTSLVMSSEVKGVVVTSESGGDYGVWFNAVAADSDGNMYVVGGNQDTGRPTVFSFTSSGNLRWKAGIDNIETDDAEAFTIGYKDDKVAVSFRYYTNSYQVGIVTLNSDTGEVDSSTVLLSPQDSNPSARSLAFTPSGNPVLVGATGGEFTTYDNLTARAGSASGVLWLDKTDLPIEIRPNGDQSWQVYTGSQWINTNDLNTIYGVQTEAITGTGTGLTASIRWEGVTDTYDNIYMQNAGTGYNVNDRIRARGSLLGGVDNTDITATATSFSDINGATVAVFDKATYPTLGTMTSTWLAIWTDTGLFQNVASVADTGTTWEVTLTNGGVDFTNPVMFTGGGNDAFMYVGNYGWGQFINKITDTPAPQKIKFAVSDSTDFSTGGPYEVRLSLQSQAYIWTPDWQHTFGDAGYQYAKDVAVDQNSGDIYIYAEASGQVNGTYHRGTLLKLNSGGSIEWSKYVEDSSENNGNQGSVVVDGSGNVITIGTNGEDYTIVTKLNSDGDLIWQSRQDNNNNWDNDPRGSVDSAGNIYISGVWYDNDEDCDVVSIMKLSGTDGTLMWARFFGNQQQYNMREFYDSDTQPFTIVGTSMFYCGFCYDVNDDEYVGVAFRLGTDGTGIGESGRWKYWEDTGAEFIDSTGDAIVVDNSFGTPVDSFSQSVNNSVTVTLTPNDVGGSDEETRNTFGSGGGSVYALQSITWGDGTIQTTHHERHGDYSFSDSTFNIPNNATLNASGNNVTMNVNNYTINADADQAYNAQTYSVNAYNCNVNAYSSMRVRGDSEVILESQNSVTVKTANAVDYRDQWIFNQNRGLEVPRYRNSRMMIQGGSTIIKAVPQSLSGHTGTLSSSPCWTASSWTVNAAKVIIRFTIDSGTAHNAVIIECLVTRNYAGGPNAADRANDVATVVITGNCGSFVQSPSEPTLTALVDSQGRMQLRLNIPYGGNSGILTYTSTEFETDTALTPPGP